MAHQTVIDALETALEQKPNDLELLLHLAQLYVDAEHADKARGLQHCTSLLSENPTHLDALRCAHKLALSLEKTQLANGYAKLIASLDGDSNSLPDDESEESSPRQKSSETTSNNNVTDPRGAKVDSENKEKQTRVRGAGLRLVTENDSSDDFFDIEDENIYLDDVAGMEHVKKRLRLSFLAPLQNPELMKAYGKSVRGGLLLYGPPGCGKTYIARALAGELGAKFMSVGLSDILDMYVGESERKLHEMFESARRYAPAVLFIDEIDALGQKRSQLRSSGMRTLVNQLLSEMDSIGADNDNLFILAATNHPWDVDSALRRPGRFDRMVAVYPPDDTARAAILELYLREKPHEKIDIGKLVAASRMFSGADLAHVCNAAAEYALENSIESGQIRPINSKDFDRVMRETRPSTLGWFESARNYAMFANEGGVYDELLEYIKKHKL